MADDSLKGAPTRNQYWNPKSPVYIMNDYNIRYFGWSSLAIRTPDFTLLFDPFYRKYCNVQWFEAEDLCPADYIAVTHGHEEHFVDVPDVARLSRATVVGPDKVVNFLQRKNHLDPKQLKSLNAGETVELPSCRLDAFGWQHRDVNLFKSIPAEVLRGNFSRLLWAWNGVTKSPFSAPYTGYRITLADGTTILNYNEGFNTKMSDREIKTLGDDKKTDILLGGMQLHFTDDVRRGVKALNPKLVLLYPPHDRLHKLWNVPSSPWEDFAAAAREAAPNATVIVLKPGDEVDLRTHSVSTFASASVN